MECAIGNALLPLDVRPYCCRRRRCSCPPALRGLSRCWAPGWRSSLFVPYFAPHRPEPLFHGVQVQLRRPASGSLPEIYRRLLLAAVVDAAGASGGSGGSSSSSTPNSGSGQPLATRAIKLPDDELPDWVALGSPKPSWLRSRNESVAGMAALNANASRRADVLVYGDSLTVGMGRNRKAWAIFNGRDALPLGMTGSTVEQLAWRVLEGGERPAVPPRAAVFFIGVSERACCASVSFTNGYALQGAGACPCAPLLSGPERCTSAAAVPTAVAP